MLESKYKRINTKSLFEEFKSNLKNLDLTEQGLCLSQVELCRQETDLLNEAGLSLKDIAIDSCDTVYVIDRKSMSILTYNRDFEKLRFPAYESGVLAPLLQDPKGIAVDENSVYLIGTLGTPEGKKEGLIALGKNDLKLLWTVQEGPGGVLLKGLKDLDIDPAGNLYVLEKARHRVLKLSLSENEKNFIEIKNEKLARSLFLPGNIYIDPKGTLHIFDRKSGDFVLENDGTFKARKINQELQEIASRRRAHDSKNNMYLIDKAGKKLSFLEYIKQNSNDPERGFRGKYFSKPVDSQIWKNTWYRFLLEGSFPKGTQIEFQYYISDKLLSENELKELPESEWEEGLSGSSSVQGEERRDALFRTKLKGRYLWFVLNLTGTENLSPVVSSVTLFFPKVSYLDYLPSVYRENSVNQDFLDRFLAIFESLFFETEFEINNLSRYFDAAGTPSEFLDWLGSWVAAPWERNPNSKKKVPEAKQREFISRAVLLYREKGTREGLENLIFLFTGKKPLIVEKLHNDCKKESPEYTEECKKYLNEYLKAEHRKSLDQCNKAETGTDELTIEKLSEGESSIGESSTSESSTSESSTSESSTSESSTSESSTSEPNAGESSTSEPNTDLEKNRKNNEEGFEQKKYLFFPPEAARVKLSEEKNQELKEVPLNAFLFGEEKFEFFVFFKEPLTVSDLELIENIIDEEKPAHTTYKIKVLEPWFYLDGYTYLGENTWLKRPEFLLEKQSILGRDTVLRTEKGAKVP